MIICCDSEDTQSLKQADLDISNLSKKILQNKKHFSFRRSLKDALKSFSSSLKFFASRNKTSKVYIAILIAGGIGDILRQKDALLDILEKFPDAVVDLYGKMHRRFFLDVKSIRFIFGRYFIGFSKNKYDIIIDYFSSDNVTSGICDLTINSLRTNALINFKKDFEYIKKQYANLFTFDSQYSFQKKALERNLNFNNVVKLTAGIKDFKKISLPLNFKEHEISKFNLNKDNKYITFQHGWGDKGYVPSRMLPATHLWETKNWTELFKKVKNMLPEYKIVQVGLASDYIPYVDINLVGKTSFNELCSVIKYSLLHIDADCGCVHIAKALNTKSLVLFGPSSAKYVGYDENINIMSNVCRDCFTISKWFERCLRGFKTPLCMQSISPNFVAEVIKNTLMRR
jgi:ADP-heptose:LPS heptosyltransferase